MRDALYHRIQSQDYANAGPLRATLVKVINEDLTPLLPRVKSPTLLVWGEHDRDVPLSAAQLMARLIPDAQLVVFENAGHFAYLEQFNRFRLLVGRFLRDRDKQAESSPA
jgi:pimeloyl-ACP methyl ester carboxylesterase